MKVFKFFYDNEIYCIAALNFEYAERFYNEEINPELGFENYSEVLEKEWDDRTILMYEDNDTAKEPFRISIREAFYDEKEAHLIFTTDSSII